MNIVSQKWYFGNGDTSTAYSPIERYDPGFYDVTLEAVGDDGITYSAEKELYIGVSEDNQTIATKEYLDNPKCLHYNWEGGWSDYSGEHWIWPSSPASVTEYEKEGIIYTLAWDMKDGKRYVINTKDIYDQKSTYLDKGTYPIATSITLPEYTGSQEHFDVTHLDTYIKFKPELLSSKLPDDFSVSAELITENKQEPVEIRKNVNIGREIEFYYSNHQQENTQGRQLRIQTNTSEFQLTNYESYFKVNDRYRTPSYNIADTSQEYFAGATVWYTKGLGYGIDRSGDITPTGSYASAEGLDGESDSAMTITGSYSLGNNVIVGGALVLWYKDTAPEFPVTLVDYATKNGWTLAYYNGDISANLTTLTATSLYDIRLFDSVATEGCLEEYFDGYINYLPEY